MGLFLDDVPVGGVVGMVLEKTWVGVGISGEWCRSGRHCDGQLLIGEFSVSRCCLVEK